MALPEGLLPVFVFVLTLGISVPVTLGAHVFHRNTDSSFRAALRPALFVAAGTFVVGAIAVWTIAGGGGALWELPATLFASGFVAFLALAALPLLVGQRLIRRASGRRASGQPANTVDADTALRFATYGWPIAMLAMFGIFVAPGGLSHGHLLTLGGEQTCLAGFCGIPVSLAGAVALELLVALLGPGVVGLCLQSSVRTRGGPSASS